jgi:uncharacterized membrane protein
MKKLNNDDISNDSKYWTLKLFYCNKDDKRWMVPNRIRALGPTFNFARPQVYYFIISIFIIVFLMFFIGDFLRGPSILK